MDLLNRFMLPVRGIFQLLFLNQSTSLGTVFTRVICSSTLGTLDFHRAYLSWQQWQFIEVILKPLISVVEVWFFSIGLSC